MGPRPEPQAEEIRADPVVEPTQKDEQPQADPLSGSKKQDSAVIEWSSGQAQGLNIRKVLLLMGKSVAILMLPVIFGYMPVWITSRFLRRDVLYTAVEFWEACGRGDRSLEDPFFPGITMYINFMWTFVFVPIYWVMPHEGIPPHDEVQDIVKYREGVKNASKICVRHVFGMIFAGCYFAVLALGTMATNGLLDGDTLFPIAISLFATGFFFGAVGLVVSAAKMNAAWANTWAKRITAPIVIFLDLLRPDLSMAIARIVSAGDVLTDALLSSLRSDLGYFVGASSLLPAGPCDGLVSSISVSGPAVPLRPLSVS